MGTHKSFLSLVQAQTARFDHVLKTGKDVMLHMGQEGQKDMVELTSGTISKRTLAAMGHPYGRGPSAKQNMRAGNSGRRGVSASYRKKHGATRMAAPLRPINRQSGQLQNSVSLRKSAPYTFDVHVGSGVKHAKYVLHPSGTKFMVGRGVMSWHEVNKAFPVGEVEKRHRGRNRALRDALKRAGRKP